MSDAVTTFRAFADGFSSDGALGIATAALESGGLRPASDRQKAERLRSWRHCSPVEQPAPMRELLCRKGDSAQLSDHLSSCCTPPLV